LRFWELAAEIKPTDKKQSKKVFIDLILNSKVEAAVGTYQS
jgi:hypothetical protein